MLIQSRRVSALNECHLVLVRFGGRTGTLLSPTCKEVSTYKKSCKGVGQNLYGALFFTSDATKNIVVTAISKDINDLLEVNSGPLGLSAPRLQRMVNARATWGRLE